ncbi:G-protein coupled receptor Fz Smo, variant 4 [Balamuthia mandrillaris]
MRQATLLLTTLLLLALSSEFAARQSNAKGGIYDAFLSPTHPDAVCVNKSELDFGSSGCEHYLAYDMVYNVPGEKLPNVSGDGIEAWRDIGVEYSIPFIPNQTCRIHSARYMCPVYFRECHEVLSPYADPKNYTREQVAVVGTYPCRDLCWEYTGHCDSSIPAELRELYYNCDVPNKYYFGFTVYDILPEGPNVTVTVSAPNGDTWDYTFQCYDGSRRVSYIGSFDCPQGMHRTGSNTCAFDCPEPLLKKDEFNTITDMMSGISWISLVMMAFLILSYLIDPTKRKFPNHLPIFFFFSVMCFSFAFCLASMLSDGTEEMLCESTNEPNYFGDGACTVQGLLIVYFFMAAVLWWLVICFNIFLMMIFAARDIDWKNGSTIPLLMGGYHCFSWFLPLLPVIIGLAAERLGSNGSDLWCTIHSSNYNNALKFIIGAGDGIETEGETANVWNFVLFWLPIVLCVFIGVSLILMVIIFQLRQESGVKGFWAFVKGQWRIFAFLALYIWVCSFLFAFQLDFLGRRNDQYDAYEDHIQCLFQKTAVDNYFAKLNRPVPAEAVSTCTFESNVRTSASPPFSSSSSS